MTRIYISLCIREYGAMEGHLIEYLVSLISRYPRWMVRISTQYDTSDIAGKENSCQTKIVDNHITGENSIAAMGHIDTDSIVASNRIAG